MRALIEIEAVRSTLDVAGDAILSAAQRGLAISSTTPVDGERFGEIFAEILALCAFQDLAGQRLDRLTHILAGEPLDQRPDAHLLNGPANGDGLDQAAADILFDQ